MAMFIDIHKNWGVVDITIQKNWGVVHITIQEFSLPSKIIFENEQNFELMRIVMYHYLNSLLFNNRRGD